jgi:hypothetical protein
VDKKRKESGQQEGEASPLAGFDFGGCEQFSLSDQRVQWLMDFRLAISESGEFI